jgi:hypothetical protein
VLGPGAYEVIQNVGDAAGGAMIGLVVNQFNPIDVKGNKLDVISGFTSNDKLTISGGTAITGLANGIISSGSTTIADNGTTVYLFRGTYNSSTGMFSLSATGDSTVVIYDTNGAAAGGLEGVLLVGFYNGNLGVTGANGTAITVG